MTAQLAPPERVKPLSKLALRGPVTSRRLKHKDESDISPGLVLKTMATKKIHFSFIDNFFPPIARVAPGAPSPDPLYGYSHGIKELANQVQVYDTRQLGSILNSPLHALPRCTLTGSPVRVRSPRRCTLVTQRMKPMVHELEHVIPEPGDRGYRSRCGGGRLPAAMSVPLGVLICLAAGLAALEHAGRQHGGTGLRLFHRNGDGQLVVMDRPWGPWTAMKTRLFLTVGSDDLTLNLNRCKARGIRRILMAGDSNMRKRFVAVARRLGVFVSENYITGESNKPFVDHRHAVDVDGVAIEYTFWTPTSFVPSPVEPALPVWAGVETAADLAESVVVANYGLWAGEDTAGTGGGNHSVYCEQLRTWKDQLLSNGMITSNRLHWLTTTPVIIDRLDGTRSNKWRNHRVEFALMDRCAESLDLQRIDGRRDFAGAQDIQGDGYHISGDFADAQAGLIAQRVCNSEPAPPH